MSNALAIAAVTHVLRDLLNDSFINNNVVGALGTSVTVSVGPPDRVVPVDGAEASQLNLFLYQVTPNQGWRNEALPSRDSTGRQRLSNPPLALNLHYLLSAYSSADLHCEILLGYAMQLLHEWPVLPREAIRTSLRLPSDTTLPLALRALASSELADQIEQIRITPEYLNTEEMSKLWTATGSHYRPTAAYQASVVLIEAQQPARAPLPVLTRGPRVRDPATLAERESGVFVQGGMVSPFPEVTSLALPASRSAALLGDDIELKGVSLDGAEHALLLRNARLGIEFELAPAESVTPTSVRFELRNDPANIPAGSYVAQLRLVKEVVPGTGPSPRLSNAFALSIAPQIITLAPSGSLDDDGKLTLTPTCTPQLRPNQRVSLILGGVEVPAELITAATDTPTFIFRALPLGSYWVRLRVDGIDSPMIDRTVTPPAFSGPQIEVRP